MENLISVGLKSNQSADFLQSSTEALTSGDDRFQKVLEKFADEVETAKDGADTLEQSASRDEDVESGSSSRIPKDLVPEMATVVQPLMVSALPENPSAIELSSDTEGVILGNVSGLETLDAGGAFLHSENQLSQSDLANLSELGTTGLNNDSTTILSEMSMTTMAAMAASSSDFSEMLSSGTSQALESLSSIISQQTTITDSEVSAVAIQPILNEKSITLKNLSISNEEVAKAMPGFNIKPEIKSEAVQPIESTSTLNLGTDTTATETDSELSLQTDNVLPVEEQQVSFKETLAEQSKIGLSAKDDHAADFQDKITSTISLATSGNEQIIEDVPEIKQTVTEVIRPAEIYHQIVDKAHLMVEAGNSEITINLKPDHLGRLNLKISMENHLVTAEFVAESEQVKAAIESNLNDLRQMLHDSGVQVQGMMVSVGGNQTGEGFESDFARYRDENQSNRIQDDFDVAQTIDDRPVAITETTIDLRA